MAKQPVPTTGTDWKEWLLKCSRAINDILKGWVNTGGLVTLAASQATTTITDARISIDSTVSLIPTTVNAAAEIKNGTLYIAETGRVNGSIVITHANNAQTDRTFRLIIIG